MVLVSAITGEGSIIRNEETVTLYAEGDRLFLILESGSLLPNIWTESRPTPEFIHGDYRFSKITYCPFS